jgi:hypothetical protein
MPSKPSASPSEGVLLEGGIWQGNKLRGHRTGISDEDRIGGLSSLGLEVWRAYGPLGKAVIEQSFNELQRAMDNVPGYIGREQRHDVNEINQRRLNLCKTGQAHPREYFMHISQLADHIQTTMENWNNERNDGKILKGRTPLGEVDRRRPTGPHHSRPRQMALPQRHEPQQGHPQRRGSHARQRRKETHLSL